LPAPLASAGPNKPGGDDPEAAAKGDTGRDGVLAGTDDYSDRERHGKQRESKISRTFHQRKVPMLVGVAFRQSPGSVAVVTFDYGNAFCKSAAERRRLKVDPVSREPS
jgi:hypothetical protein